MWLFTTRGFYSVTLAYEGGPDDLQIRGRTLEALHALQARHPVLADLEVVVTPTADYWYRIVTTRAVVAQVVADEAKAIDYGNFKAEAYNATLRRPGSTHFMDALHSVWAALRRTQLLEAPAPGTVRPAKVAK